MTDPVDLLIKNAWLVATMDDQRRELTGGWVAISDGYVVGIGAGTEVPPAAQSSVDASGCLVFHLLLHPQQDITQNH